MDNSFASVHPELVGEWSDRNLPIEPDQVSYGSKKLYWWKGSCGHEWQASPKSRSAGERCPICSGARIIAGINDLATLKPELVCEWSEKNGDLKPTMVSPGSHKKVIWKCKQGHEWMATIKNRAMNNTGCPYCSHNLVLEGFNDLQTLEPNISKEWSPRNYPLMPTQVTAYANRKVWWKCKTCGYEWETLISTRSYGSKCPCCSGRILLPGRNDLDTKYPGIAAEWSEKNLPLEPSMVNEKSVKNVWWKCSKCGYEWKAVIKSRVKGSCCPVCADRLVRTGLNDLATTDPSLVSEWDYSRNKDVLPTNVSRNSSRIVWWKCACGHSWRGRISERTLEGKKCGVCEQEYRYAFPSLIIAFYAHREGLQVVTNSEKLLGIPLENYIPEEGIVIETDPGSIKTKDLKEFMCSKRGIIYEQAPFKKSEDDINYANKIKMIFHKKNIFIRSDTEHDVMVIRHGFYEWKRRCTE